MSFSGNLDDVTVIDLFQFIRIGARTGTLTLIRGLDHAEVSFHGGAIVSASGPGSLRLGELLLVADLIDMETLDAALELQAHEQPRRNLGRILVDGGLPREDMYQAVRQQIEEVVRHLVSWRTGSFEFAPDEIKHLDELALQPGEAPVVQLDTQSVLLEALQLLDESRRDSAEKPPPEPPEPPAPKQAEALPLRLQLVTRDATFADALAHRLEKDGISIARLGLHEAGSAPPGEAAPLVMLDLRAGAVPVEALAALRRTRPRAWLLCVVEDRAPVEQIYEAGAITALPPVPEVWARWIKNLNEGRDLSGGPRRERRRDFARLRRVFEDLRSGLISTSISLSLMNVVSESVERCVLLLARPDALVAVGAFGAGPSGRSLAQVAAGMRFDLSARNAFSACVESASPIAGSVAESTLPAAFFQRIGRPRTGKFAVLPMTGGQRVVALIYVDNGVSDRALDDMDMLELASSQAGLAFENELLRREVARTAP